VNAAAPWLVLIGPAGAGKSTLGREIAARVGREFVDIDEAGVPYYEEMGWPVARIYRDSERNGWIPTERAWEEARAHAVEQVLAHAPGHVVALGAAHTNYTDPALFSRVERAVTAAEHVLWIEPHPEPERSLAVLRARNIAHRQFDYQPGGHDILAEWLGDERARALATHKHYTQGHTVEQSVELVLGELSHAQSAP